MNMDKALVVMSLVVLASVSSATFAGHRLTPLLSEVQLLEHAFPGDRLSAQIVRNHKKRGVAWPGRGL